MRGAAPPRRLPSRHRAEPPPRRGAAGAADADGAEAAAGEGPVIDPVDAQRDEAEPDADAAVKPAARRRRRSSSTRADEAHRATTTPTAPSAPTAPSEPSAPKPARSRPAKTKTVEEQVAAGGPTRGIRTTRSRTGRDGRRRREPLPTPPRVTDKPMVITQPRDGHQIPGREEGPL